MGWAGFEPATSQLAIDRSIQLIYHPTILEDGRGIRTLIIRSAKPEALTLRQSRLLYYAGHSPA